jgi:hypothetical protein
MDSCVICTDIEGVIEEMEIGRLNDEIKEIKSNVCTDNITGKRVVEYVMTIEKAE